MDPTGQATGGGEASTSAAYPPTINAQGTVEDSRLKSKWWPGNWGWKRWAGFIVGMAIIVVVVVVPIKLIEDHRYPDYTRLKYSLADSYRGLDFFEKFDYGNGTEATHGFTNYVTREGAAWSNLTFATATEAIIRVLDRDNTGSAGRPTVKIMSKQRYTRGLFIFDILHSPYGCGAWPAIWTSDPDPDVWPANGEIDVVEAVNRGNKGAQMTLHTAGGCSMSVKRHQTGDTLSTNCLNSTNENMGCAVRGPIDSFGEVFNQNGGGVFAMEWRTAGIRVWFFQRNKIPEDIDLGLPDPSLWGTATADFPSTKCHTNSHFKNHQIIINISLCGDWAGAEKVYKTEYDCPGDCAEHVGNDPAAFQQAYWSIKNIMVYNATNS